MVPGTSLVVQWLRLHLPMQGTQVWSLLWGDPTGCGDPDYMPVHPNYWTPLSSLCAATIEAHVLCNEKPPRWEACTLQWVAPQRKPSHSNKDPVQPKVNKFFKKINKIHLKINTGFKKRERDGPWISSISIPCVC